MKRIVACIVLFVMVGTSVLGASLTDQLKSTNSKISSTKNDLAEVQKDKKVTLNDITNLDKSIDSAEREINRLTEQINELETKLEIQEEELRMAEEKVKTQDELLKVRMVARYETGTVSFLDVLFSSKDISDFISKYYLLGEALEYDTNLLNQIKEQKKYIEDTKLDLENQKAEREKLKQESETKKLALNQKKETRTKYLSQLQKSETELSKTLDSLVAAADSLEAEIKKAQSSSSSSSKYTGGSMTWPLPGYYTITSPYGNRLHPILKVYKLHTGIDIAGSGCNGKPIVAANSGTVIKAEMTTTGYGNCVIIDHGGGISTLYGHGSVIVVKKGDKVTKGQTIMKVGTTGYSTGPHLHFEVRENGKYVNPLDSSKGYLKK